MTFLSYRGEEKRNWPPLLRERRRRGVEKHARTSGVLVVFFASSLLQQRIKLYLAGTEWSRP